MRRARSKCRPEGKQFSTSQSRKRLPQSWHLDLWVYFPAPDLQVYFPAPHLWVYFPAPELWVYLPVLDLLETSLLTPINLLLSI